MTDSFKSRTELNVGDRSYEIFNLQALPAENLARLPYSLKILLENLLRFEDGVNVTRADIDALLAWDPKATPSYEIAFTPSRVILQDFTGVPCVVDLAAMRDAIVRLGGDADKVNPLAPAATARFNSSALAFVCPRLIFIRSDAASAIASSAPFRSGAIVSSSGVWLVICRSSRMCSGVGSSISAGSCAP